MVLVQVLSDNDTHLGMKDNGPNSSMIGHMAGNTDQRLLCNLASGMMFGGSRWR